MSRGGADLALPLTLDLAAVAANPDRISWAFFRPGVRVHWLSETAGGASAFLRYEPGAGVPAHEHRGTEHILVLSGWQRDHRGRYDAGSLVINQPGSRHAVDCPEGALVLVIWGERPRFLGES